MNKDHLFKLAREESFKSDYKGCASARIGCVAVLKGAVIAKGFNSDKTHTFQKKYNKYRFKEEDNYYLPAKIHAEASALAKMKYLDVDFSKIELYIYRELKNGKLAMARPCPSCMAAIKEFGIKKINYTTPDGMATELIKGELK